MNWFRKPKTRKRITQVAKILDKTTGQMVGSRLLITNHPYIRDFRDLVYFTLTCSKPLPTHDDFDRFNAVQDRMDELIYDWEFCCVGIITHDGHRNWVLYAKEGQRLMDRLFVEFSDFAPQMDCEPDPEWSHYRQLLKQK